MDLPPPTIKITGDDAVRRAREAVTVAGMPEPLRQVLLLRIAHPALSVAGIARIAGLTTSQCAGRLRRGLGFARRPEKKINGFDTANHRRTRVAAETTVIKAVQAVKTPGMPAVLHRALCLRIDNPTLSLTELGALDGLSKDAIAGRIRRALEFARRA